MVDRFGRPTKQILGIRGGQIFTATGVFTVPAGVGRVLIYLSNVGVLYAIVSVPVIPGQTIPVTVSGTSSFGTQVTTLAAGTIVANGGAVILAGPTSGANYGYGFFGMATAQANRVEVMW